MNVDFKASRPSLPWANETNIAHFQLSHPMRNRKIVTLPVVHPLWYSSCLIFTPCWMVSALFPHFASHWDIFKLTKPHALPNTCERRKEERGNVFVVELRTSFVVICRDEDVSFWSPQHIKRVSLEPATLSQLCSGSKQRLDCMTVATAASGPVPNQHHLGASVL